MNIDIINECTKLSIQGDITFPEVVRKLAANGVERYIVDLIGKQKFSFGSNDETHISTFFIEASQVNNIFASDAIQRAIKSIQQQEIKYLTFLNEIMAGGCSHYEVFIQGKKAIYFGRNGDMHIEYFPVSA